MVFVSAANAKMKNGKLKKGVTEITDKNGRVRYIGSAVGKPDEVKTNVKKVEKKEPKTKGVTKEPVKKVVVKKPKKNKEDEPEEEKLKVEFD